MKVPIKPTRFDSNPYEPEWFDRDFIHSQDGVREWPDHHCKRTYLISKPFITRYRNAIDIGCRDGEYTRYLQHDFSHTYCFDPRRRAFFALNVPLDRATHFTCALGDQTGDIVMYGGTHDPAGTKRAVVPCFPLDAFRLQDIDYIKVDVEGYEKKVLLGAQRTIERCRPVIVIEQNVIHLPGDVMYSARDWLLTRGYQVATTCPRGWDHVMVPT